MLAALKFTIHQDFASGSMSDSTEKNTKMGDKMETSFTNTVFTTMDTTLTVQTKTINSVIEVTEL